MGVERERERLTGMGGERENDRRERIKSSHEWNFVLKGVMDILSAPADVTMLTMKVLKISAIFDIIFFRSISFEINPLRNFIL